MHIYTGYPFQQIYDSVINKICTWSDPKYDIVYGLVSMVHEQTLQTYSSFLLDE